MWDVTSTDPSIFNHIPGGSNVLYMDGHVAFVKYTSDSTSCENQPVIGSVAALVGALSGAL